MILAGSDLLSFPSWLVLRFSLLLPCGCENSQIPLLLPCWLIYYDHVQKLHGDLADGFVSGIQLAPK